MKIHDLIPFSPPALDAGTPGASSKPRLRNIARLSGLPAVLLLCLGCFLLPFGAGAAPQPEVTIYNVPSQVLIGEVFTFNIKFRNLTTDVGWGPFIDIVMDTGGFDKCAGCNAYPSTIDPINFPPHPDGLTIVSATLVTGVPQLLTGPPPVFAPCLPSGFGATLPHGLAPGNGPPLGFVMVSPAEALYTYRLPFGHYEATQPDLEIAVQVRVDEWADANMPLGFRIRGGFEFGATEFKYDFATDAPILSTASLGLLQNSSILWGEAGSVIPTVLTLSKGYDGPEGEAATGPNYLDSYNYPLTYTVNVNIADQQEINNLVFQDCFPPTLVYRNNVQVWIHGVLMGAGVDYDLTMEPPQTGPQISPNNVLEIDFLKSNPITGTTAPNDVVIKFEFHIPKFDANNIDILAANCSASILNLVKATGDWTPEDPCDAAAPIVAGPVQHTLTAKCLAVQKSVRFVQPGDYTGAVFGDLKSAGATPDDLLRYEIRFQISDFKTIGNLVLRDELSDGQSLIFGFPTWPQLTVSDQFGTVVADFNNVNYGSAWNIDLDITSLCSMPSGLSANRFTFDISKLMMAQTPPHMRHAAGILTGGHATAPTSPTPATGTLVFYATIDDAFTFWNQSDVPGVQDRFVDKHDPLLNCVEVRGELFQNKNDTPPLPLPTGIITSDDSRTTLSIVGAPFEKTVYAVNNGIGNWVGYPNPPNLAPGDLVTFRLMKTFPSGDAEDVVLRDFPPLPVLKVAAYTWPTAPLPIGAGPPPPGQSQYGPTHTVPTTLLPAIVSAPNTPNELRFDFGSFNNTANTPYVIDILFTMTVSSDPFADGLTLNNEAVECEDNTLDETSCQVALAEIKIVEPNLRITKGVVATSNPLGVFMPFPPGLTGQPVFTAPGSACPRFTPTVSSTEINPALGGVPVVSDLWCAKPGDRVTYAIILENLGHSPKGAFDIIIKDALDPHCFVNVGNLCVRRGDGATFTTTGNLFVGGGLAFADFSSTMGALSAFHATSGENIIVITFDATFLPATPVLDCCANRVDLVNYSNVEGGANFVTAGFGAQLSDTALVCTNLYRDLSITKTAMGTFMAGLNGNYMITVMNKGCAPVGAPVTVTDTVPAGLTLVSAAGSDWACSISGGTLTCIYTGPPIPPGGSFPPITVSVLVAGSAGGITLVNCADVQSPNDNNPANNHGCVTVDVLTNKCFAITNEMIMCSNNGTYVFEFDLVNLSDFPTAQVSFVMEGPYGVTVSPDPFLFGTLVNPGGIGHVKVVITGPGCGKVCFLMSIHDTFGVNCCTPNVGIKKCLVLPECPCVPAPSGMVVWLRGDNTPTDSTGLGNNGAWVGNPNYSFGEVGQAFSVANASDYVSVPDPSNGSLDFNATDSFSIDAWIRTVNNGIAAIVDKRSSTTGSVLGYEFYVAGGGRLGFQLNGVNHLSPGPVINDGEWYHVAEVVDRPNAQVRLYVNGTQVDTAVISSGIGSVANNGDLRIGQDRFLNSSFNGQIDEVEIFNRALTPAEIKSLWMAGCAGKCKCVAPPPGLTNWWRFDVKVGSTVFDSAGLVLNNGLTTGTLQPGKVGNALCFNGVNQWMQVANNSEVQFTGTCPGGNAQSLTMDFWFKTSQAGTVANPTTILDKRTSFLGPRGYMAALVNGRPSFTMADGVNHTYTVTTGPSLADGQWHFIAITYERCAGMLKFYVDGNFASVATFSTGPLGSLSIFNNAPLRVGRRSQGFGNNYFYLGCIDELEFFKRALTDLEIFSIWNAGSAGKCRPGQPAIGQAPINQWSKAGSNAVFNVVALSEDNDPLSYQWLFNGVPIAGGTNDTLTVFNAQPASVGAYSVVVANGFGSVTSTPATLTVVGSNICTLLIQSGDNLWANQLNNGDNKLALLIPDAPEGSQVFQYDNVTDAFRIATFSFGSWDNEITLNPGGGAILRNSGDPFTLTLTGTPVLPALPRALSTGYNSAARQDLGPGTFGNTVGSPPTEGTVVYQFNPSIGGDASDLESAGFRSYAFIGGAWESEYEALPGESVVIVVPPLTDVVPPVLVTASASCSNNMVTVLFSEVLDAASAVSPFNYSLNGPTIQGAMLRPDGKTVDLNTSSLQTSTPYTLTVNGLMDLAGNAIAANSQITIGCSASNLPPQTIIAGVTSGKLMFNWSGLAVLQEADTPAGPWTNVVGASSGYMTTTAAAQKFYRLLYQ